jgi:arylsulfatase A-like enzyme
METSSDENPIQARSRETEGPIDPPASLASLPTQNRLPVLLLASWFGLAAGLLELVLLVFRVKVFEKGVFLKSSHFLWMIPVADLGLFLAFGLVLGLLARAWPNKGPALMIGGFVFLTVLSQLLLIPGLMMVACLMMAGGCARLATPIVLHRRSLFVKLVKFSAPVFAATLIVIAGSTFAHESLARRAARSGRPMAAPDAPNVLLIVLDTVRADHLSLYGYGRETTPNLSRLAKRGVRFDRVHSTAPWTLPSHASLMTGRWPHELDVERHGGLDTTYPTLAEFLRGRGYATAGIVANQFYCGHESGLNRGFDDYRDFPIGIGETLRSSTLGWLLMRTVNRVQDELAARFEHHHFASLAQDFQRKDGDLVNREFLDWLDLRDGRPFFTFLNYFDVHGPYVVPSSFHQHFGKSPDTYEEGALIRDWWKESKAPHSAEDLRLLIDSYDDCIAALDQQLGRLFDELTRRGLFEKTLVVVTADHGEEFGEHGHYTHGFDLYEPETHVPLLVFGPSRVPGNRVVNESVSLRDLPATIVDLLGFGDKAPFPGTSLARTWEKSHDQGPATPEIAISELRSLIEPTLEKATDDSETGQSTALFDENFAYIKDQDGHEELYDLELDARQSHDISRSPESEPILARFRKALKASVIPSPAR